MSDLALDAISVRRGERIVLDAIDASFAAGRLTAVIGPNGAGKSTLLAAAAGLIVPAAGTVRLGGTPLAALPRRDLARRRAYLPQSPRVDWAISVERVVALGLIAQLPAFGGLSATWRLRIDAALDRHDLLSLRNRLATGLSGGELARVMLARATVGAPELLLADEPTAGLDPRHVIDAGVRLRALADAGCTVVVALHDLDLAVAIADDMLALRDGRVVAAGPVDTIATEPVLSALYDVAVRIRRDDRGTSIGFG